MSSPTVFFLTSTAGHSCALSTRMPSISPLTNNRRKLRLGDALSRAVNISFRQGHKRQGAYERVASHLFSALWTLPCSNRLPRR